jgi:hypothetical protein
MRYHTASWEDELDKVKHGRAILEFVAESASELAPAWKAILAQQRELIGAVPDAVVRFDQLAEVNEGCWFHELVAELPRRGLTYLCEASISAMMPDHIPPEGLRVLEQLADDRIRRQQYLDFLGNRRFRCSLLVHASAPISRKLELARLFDVHLASRARPDAPDGDVFRVPNAAARVASTTTRRVLHDLSTRYPASRRFGEVLAAAGDGAAQLAVDLFQLFSHDLVELWPYPDPFVVEPGERPRAAPLARALAARDSLVANLRHEAVELYPEERELVRLVDGTRDAAALQAALPRHDVPALLRLLGKKALLLGE